MIDITEDFTTRSKLQDIGRFYVTEFVKSISSNLNPGTSILDAGAGECVYKIFFKHCEYKSIDLAIGEQKWNYRHLDYIAPLDNMPIKDETFYAVLCTQSLEHLQNPLGSVKEIYRVLQVGGYLFLTAPMAHNEHQIPHDYFRYTSYGLEYICRAAGFREIKITSFGGMFVRWAYELPRMLSIFPGTGIKKGKVSYSGLLVFPIKLVFFFGIRLMQAIFLRLDRFDKLKDDPFGWQLVAKK